MQIFTLEQLKSHSWNIAKETAHPSVGRSLSAGHHRLILPLYRLRLNAPPQDRLHRSNVTMLARAKPNIPHREPLRTIHTFAISLVFPMAYNHDLQGWRHFINPPLANRLGWSANSQDTSKTKLQQDHCPIMEKSARRSFQMGLCLALLCKPPLERITRHFVILPRQIAFFGLCISP